MLYKNCIESIECYFDFLIALSVWWLGDTLYVHYILFLSIMLPTDENYFVFFQPGGEMLHTILISAIFDDCCHTHRILSIIVLLPTAVDLHLPLIWTMRRYSEIIYSTSVWEFVGDLKYFICEVVGRDGSVEFMGKITLPDICVWFLLISLINQWSGWPGQLFTQREACPEPGVLVTFFFPRHKFFYFPFSVLEKFSTCWILGFFCLFYFYQKMLVILINHGLQNRFDWYWFILHRIFLDIR